MPLDLARIEKKAISESVAEQLRTAILRGEVQVGERLPPERELAPRFGTNRNTLREAIRSLEAQGLVIARQGDGVRVADFRNTGSISLLPDLIRVASSPERNLMLDDILQMRRRMAVELAGLAAKRADDGQIQKLRDLLDRQKDNDGDLLLSLQTDLELYNAMVDASCSVVAKLMFTTLSRLSQACLEKVPALLYVHPEYLELMGRTVAAIASRDPEAAEASLDELYRKTDAVLMARLERLG
jgi:DNA-binding FadR family transcriptional regulator